MFPTYKNPPPFSPILLAGIVARPLPLPLLQPFLSKIFTVLIHRHPGLFERLSDLTDPTFLIDPVDLPLAFVLDATPEHPSLTAGRKANKDVAAVIRGPLLTLIDLMEGRLDGDALFFSRALKIEGDTEAVVALRNAIDDAGINLTNDILESFGPFAPPARQALGLGGRIYARLRDDLELLRASSQTPNSGGS